MPKSRNNIEQQSECTKSSKSADGCSGHGAMKENHFLDDGAYSAVQIIIETVRRRLAGEGDIAIELLKQLKEPKDASEFRLKITVHEAEQGPSC